MIFKKTFLIFFSSLFLFSCVSTPRQDRKTFVNGNTLIDKYWILAGIKTEQGFLAIPPNQGNSSLIRFYKDGKFEASSGLNNGIGLWSKGMLYKKDVYRFSFPTISTTKMAGVNKTEDNFDYLFFSSLKNARYIKISHNMISFLDANSNELLKFLTN